MVVRPAEPRDDRAVAALLYETAAGRYDLFTGNRDRALKILSRTIARPGNDTSRDGAIVVEIDGQVAGAVVSFPAIEETARRRRSLRQALRRRAPWRWPRILRNARLGERISPPPGDDALYIDALASDERFRRRGVGTALLDAAAERARALGLRKLALDTGAANAPARALYERYGFRLSGEVPATGSIPAIVFYELEVA
jgi:ribosomal protein S18 acetylase RimI-like enzyme